MAKEFKFAFEDLNIQPKDLSELLGFEDNLLPEPFPEIIQQALNDAPNFCDLKGGYKIFDRVAINLKEESIQIEDKLFFPSKIVTTQLKNAKAAAVFICTAGAEISNHSSRVSKMGDAMLGYIFDVIGSVAVEKATEKIQEILKGELLKSKLGITDRFSPGYCEWNVAEQQKLFQLMPRGFCGVSLSQSSLMNPIKSVSGIIGIGTGLKEKGYQCQWCNDVNCIYGQIKRKKQQ